jgi:hypothetical protein
MSSPSLKPPAVVRWLSVLIVVVALVVRFWPHGAFAPGGNASGAGGSFVAPTSGALAAPEPAAAVGARVYGESVGFRSRERLEQHFRKHGREFKAASAEDYLRRAQTLRDRPAGGDVLEMVRADHVVCRFDRASGAFIAFGPDGIIRTFFRPTLGERYFERQASRPADAP